MINQILHCRSDLMRREISAEDSQVCHSLPPSKRQDFVTPAPAAKCHMPQSAEYRYSLSRLSLIRAGRDFFLVNA